MGFYMSLENTGRASADYKRRSTYAHGLRLLRAIVREGLLENVQFGKIMFRGLATLGEEMFINNKGSYLGTNMESEIIEIIEQIEKVREESDVRYPYFLPDTLETTIFWTSSMKGVPCSGYVTFRESRAEGVHDFGNAEIDLFTVGSENPGDVPYDDEAILADYLMNQIKSEEMGIEVLERIVSTVLHSTQESRLFGYRVPKQVTVSSSERPLPRFYEAYVLGIHSEKSLPKIFSNILKEIPHLWSSMADKHYYLDKEPPVEYLQQAFRTLKPTLLNGVLVRSQVYNQLLENAHQTNISIKAGSLLVSSGDSLWGFLEAMIYTYDSILTPIYELITSLLDELGLTLK